MEKDHLSARADQEMTPGKYLQAERMKRNVSLEEISESTGILITVLQAIEKDDRRHLPPDVFVKGFIKLYADFLGLDHTHALNLYNQYYGGRQAGFSNIDMAQEMFSKGKLAESSLFLTWKKALILLVIILISFLSYLFYQAYTILEPEPLLNLGDKTEKPTQKSLPVTDQLRIDKEHPPKEAPSPPLSSRPDEWPLSGERDTSVRPHPFIGSDPVFDDGKATGNVPKFLEGLPLDTATTGEEKSDPAPFTSSAPEGGSAMFPSGQFPTAPLEVKKRGSVTDQEAKPEAAADAAAPDEKKLATTVENSGEYVLTAKFKDVTWIRVQTDDRQAVQDLYQKGSTHVWKSRKGFKVTIGNAGGVDLYLNDEPVLEDGKTGQVLKLTLP